MPQQWKDATIELLHTKKGRSDSNKCRRVALVVHAGKMVLKIVVDRLSEYYAADGTFPENTRSGRLARSTIDIPFGCAGCRNLDER